MIYVGVVWDGVSLPEASCVVSGASRGPFYFDHWHGKRLLTGWNGAESAEAFLKQSDAMLRLNTVVFDVVNKTSDARHATLWKVVTLRVFLN